MIRFFRGSLRPTALLALVLAAGCASSGNTATSDPGPTGDIEPTVVSYTEYRDPLIGMNRAVFAFNDFSYRYLLFPLARAYRWVLPDPVERSIGNFFRNLKMPISLVNNLLQGRPAGMGRNLARFGINTTVGLAGLFDPAAAWFRIEPAATGFDDTLARWGAGYGAYLVLPFLGPSSLRNGPGLVADYFLNPVPYLLESPESTAATGFDNFQRFAPGSERYLQLHRESKDPYLFFRNLHLQGLQRDAEYSER